ncbi:MAG: protein phosphatase 2C domain-containing protein [Cyanobacteriota bacterium]
MEDVFFNITYSSITDKGAKERYITRGNEDSICVNIEDNIYCVSDGVGGSSGGWIASRLTTSTFNTICSKKLKEERNASEAIMKAMKLTQEAIFSVQKSDKNLKEMAATFSGVVYIPQENSSSENEQNALIVFHVGDSRIYIFNEYSKDISQITSDHSNSDGYLMRAMGIENSSVDYKTIKINTSSKILICTDGVTKVISENKLGELLSENDLNKIVEKIKEIVYQGNAPDNFSAIILRFEKNDSESNNSQFLIKDSKNLPEKNQNKITLESENINNDFSFQKIQKKVDRLFFINIILIILICFQLLMFVFSPSNLDKIYINIDDYVKKENLNK